MSASSIELKVPATETISPDLSSAEVSPLDESLKKIKSLEGYDTDKHSTLFENLFRKISTQVFALDSVAFTRIYERLEKTHVDNAYNILNFITLFLDKTIQEHKANLQKLTQKAGADKSADFQTLKNQIIVAIRLLDDCPITSIPILEILKYNDDKSKLAKIIPDTVMSKIKSNPKKGVQQFADKFKSLLQEYFIEVDAQGNVYQYVAQQGKKLEKRKPGAISLVGQDKTEKIISLDTSIHYEFLYRYFFVLELLRDSIVLQQGKSVIQLGSGAEKFLKEVSTYGFALPKLIDTKPQPELEAKQAAPSQQPQLETKQSLYPQLSSGSDSYSVFTPELPSSLFDFFSATAPKSKSPATASPVAASPAISSPGDNKQQSRSPLDRAPDSEFYQVSLEGSLPPPPFNPDVDPGSARIRDKAEQKARATEAKATETKITSTTTNTLCETSEGETCDDTNTTSIPRGIIALTKDLEKFSSRNFVRIGLEKLGEYKKEKLILKKIDEKSYQVSVRKGVPPERLSAWHNLNEHLDQNKGNDFAWTQFRRLYNHRGFRHEAGHYEGFLAYVTAQSSLWGIMNDLRDFINNQNNFFERFRQDKILTYLLSNPTCFYATSPQDLAMIFEKCSNPKLFIELLIQNDFFKDCAQLIAYLHQDDNLQTKFFREFKDETLLTSLIRHHASYNILTRHDLARIYHYSNRLEFIDLLVKHNRLEGWQAFDVETHLGERASLEAGDISAMTDDIDIDHANKVRHAFNLKQKIPQGYVRPGIHDAIEQLPPEMLYQLATDDLSQAEHYLISQFRGSVLCNNFPDLPKLEDKKEEKTSPIAYFLIPSAIIPLLVDLPDEKQENKPESKPVTTITESKLETKQEIASETKPTTSKKDLTNDMKKSLAFRKNLQLLLFSYQPKAGEKPIVFSGVVNTDGNHYMPYFIFKNNAGKIQVILINPSAASQPWTTEKNYTPETPPCPKEKIYRRLEKIFHEIFPGCDVIDPNISQQIRQRSCGYNALTVLENVYQGEASGKPVFHILKNEQGEECLAFVYDNPEDTNSVRLSINFNLPDMRCYDFQKCSLVLSPKANEIEQLNREKWAARFRKEKLSHGLMLCDAVDYSNYNDTKAHKLSYQSPCREASTIINCDLLAYDYDKNIRTQVQQDKIGELRNEVILILTKIKADEMAETNKEINRAKRAKADELTFQKLLEAQSAGRDADLSGIDYADEPLEMDLSAYQQELKKNLTNGWKDVDQARDEFISTLQLPPAEQMQEIVTKIATSEYRAILEEIKRIDPPIEATVFIQRIFADNLKPLFPIAISTFFNSYLQTYKLADLKIEPVHIVDNFLKIPKVFDLYKDINSREETRIEGATKVVYPKIDLRNALIKKAEEAYQQKIIDYHFDAIDNFLRLNLNMILRALPIPRDRNINLALITYLEQLEGPISRSFIFLTQAAKHREAFINKINQHKQFAIQHIAQQTLLYLTTRLNACTLPLLPKPTREISLLVPEFFALLPQDSSVRPIGAAVIPADLFCGEGIHNLFAFLLADEIDHKLKQAYSQNLYRLVIEENLKKRLESKDTQDYLDKQETRVIVKLTQDSDYAQEFAHSKPLELYSIQQEFKLGHIQTVNSLITQTFQNTAKLHLEKRFLSIANIIMNHYYLIGKDRLEHIFANLFNNNSEEITGLTTLVTLVSNLFRVKDEFPGKETLSNSLSGESNDTTLRIFAAQFAEKIVEIFKNILNTSAFFHAEVSRHIAVSQSILQIFTRDSNDSPSSATSFSAFNNTLLQLTTLKSILEELKYQPYEVFKKQLQETQNTLNASLQHACLALFSLLQHNLGDIRPNKGAICARLYLARILNIANPSPYLTSREAFDLDRHIDAKMKDLQSLRLVLPLNIRLPIFVEPKKEIPNTYGKSLTPRLLHQIVANWMYYYDERMLRGRAFPFLLATVFNTLNQLPEGIAENDLLPNEWCKALYKLIIKQVHDPKDSSENRKIADEFFFALLNSENFAPTTPQTVPEAKSIAKPAAQSVESKQILKSVPDELDLEVEGLYAQAQNESKGDAKAEVKTESKSVATKAHAASFEEAEQLLSLPTEIVMLSALDNLLNLYKRQQVGHSFQRYFMLLEAQIDFKKEESNPWSSFQRGGGRAFFGTVNSDLKLLEECIQGIKRHHQIKNDGADVPLDASDVNRLEELLRNRWQALCSKSQQVPLNYRDLSKASATDNIYVLLALLIKQALANYGKNTYTFNLLMPGLVTRGDVDLGGAEEVYSPHIDEWKFNDIVTFADGRWLPIIALTENYQKTNTLVDCFTGNELSSKDIQHIVTCYPDVAEQLLAILKSREINPFNDALKQKFLKVIRTLNLEAFRKNISDKTYTNNMTAIAELEAFINGQNPIVRNAILSTQIPGSGDTLGSLLGADESTRAATCNAEYTQSIALTLWANSDVTPQDLGELYLRFKSVFDGTPRKRTARLVLDESVARDLAPNELPLLHFYLNRDEVRKAAKSARVY